MLHAFTRSFSQLVHDNQFSMLGIALLAEMARIQAIVAPIAHRPLPLSEVVNHHLDRLASQSKELEDVGRPIQRLRSPSPEPDFAAQEPISMPEVSSHHTTHRTALRSMPTSKHKACSKPQNVIDQLFQALT